MDSFYSYVTSLEKEVMRLRNQVFACSAQFGSNVKDETFTERDLQNNPLAGMTLIGGLGSIRTRVVQYSKGLI